MQSIFAAQPTITAADTDDCGIAWRYEVQGSSRIRFRAFRAEDGAIADLGGACAGGGTNVASCANWRHPSYVQRLFGAASSVPVAFGIGFAGPSTLVCGGCTLIPGPQALYVSVGSTSVDGNASILLPLSSPLIGVTYESQWLTVTQSANGCFGVSFSNGLGVTIQ